MRINPHIISDLRTEANLSYEQLSQDTKISVVRLRAFEQGGEAASDASMAEVNALAKSYSVPVFAFFGDNFQRPNTPLLDFRMKKPESLEIFGPIGRFSERLRSIHDFILHLSRSDDQHTQFGFKRLPDLSDASPEQAALSVVSNLRLNSDIRDKFEHGYQYYNYVRRQIESAGIFVYHDSVKDTEVRGAALTDKKRMAPVIWINTYNQNTSSRLFTLLHELCHVLSGQSGISNTYKSLNETETHCNRFAASVLMPRTEFVSIATALSQGRSFEDKALIRRIARHFFVSQHATVIRLIELKFLQDSYHQDWISSFDGEPLPEEEPGFGRATVYVAGLRKLSQFGFSISLVLEQSLKNKLTDEVEIFQNLGLKPQFLRGLFNARSDRSREIDSKVD